MLRCRVACARALVVFYQQLTDWLTDWLIALLSRRFYFGKKSFGFKIHSTILRIKNKRGNSCLMPTFKMTVIMPCKYQKRKASCAGNGLTSTHSFSHQSFAFMVVLCFGTDSMHPIRPIRAFITWETMRKPWPSSTHFSCKEIWLFKQNRTKFHSHLYCKKWLHYTDCRFTFGMPKQPRNSQADTPFIDAKILCAIWLPVTSNHTFFTWVGLNPKSTRWNFGNNWESGMFLKPAVRSIRAMPCKLCQQTSVAALPHP